MDGNIASIFVMLNNFFHDLAVGILFSNILLSLLFCRLIEKQKLDSARLTESFVRLSSRITWGALTFIVAGGIVRTATYRSYEWAEAAGRNQVTALIVKHMLLIACTAAGIYFQVGLSRKYSCKNNKPAPTKREQYT
jgi:hypothetical protein